MGSRATATFEITSWEQTELHQPEEGPALGKAMVRKVFTGDLEATSVADLLTCQAAEDAAGYVASEVVEGTLAGKTGSFVIQHGGTIDGTTTTPFGYIVPGSGTGELAGLRGSAEFRHDENGAILTLDYEFT